MQRKALSRLYQGKDQQSLMDGLTETMGYQGESSRDPAGSRLVSLKKGDFGVPAPYTLRGAAPPGRLAKPKAGGHQPVSH